ncbi:MAG: hypothetical protein N2039_02510 [Gemmataceae bacterium]|nr:hypothetical protein [Gemmataceae bacterium]
MTPRRVQRVDVHSDSTEQLFPILASEPIRRSTIPPPADQPIAPKSPEERVSLFWRIFGGTLLSITALGVLTAYQSVSSSISDLRNGLSHLSESKAEFIKKDEYAALRQRTWDSLTELQKEIASMATPLNQIKDRLSQVEEQIKLVATERREMHEWQATIKERVLQLEQQLTAIKAGQKDLLMLQQAITALQEKSMLRDQQLKQVDDDRKELLKELQALRERLARVEAAREAVKEAAPPKTGSDSTSRPQN